MRRKVHGATVDEVIDEEGARAFMAVCLETGARSDCWAFPDERWSDDTIIYATEAEAIEAALGYLADDGCGSHGGCPGARHIMEHDRPSRTEGGGCG